MTILKEQVGAVLDRRAEYETAGAYYEGQVPEVFANRFFAHALARSGYNSKLNFCRPVVDAVFNRLEIKSVVATTQAAQKVIDQTWEFNELGLDSDEIHRRALVYGDCYVMVWPDEEGNLEISYNTPLTTAIAYDPESPRKKLYAVKMWEVADNQGGYTRLNVYYPDRIEKYRATGVAVSDGTQWSGIGTVENPFGEIPVFHFRTERPFGRPEHKDAYDSQDYINKQFNTSMWVSDYQGAPQRYALSRAGEAGELKDFTDDDTTRENEGALHNTPGGLWDLVGYDKVGEFKPADPKVFWEPIKDTIRAVASLTNTPLHYFEKTGNVPSGEALRVAEAPLIKKVDRRKEAFGSAWRDTFRFVLKVAGINADVQIKWADIESLDELERWDLAAKERNVGVSLRQVLRERGYDNDVIERIIQEAVDERAVGDVTGYERVANTNPDVRTQPQNDERNVA